jgi:hypothetical protein
MQWTLIFCICSSNVSHNLKTFNFQDVSGWMMRCNGMAYIVLNIFGNFGTLKFHHVWAVGFVYKLNMVIRLPFKASKSFLLFQVKDKIMEWENMFCNWSSPPLVWPCFRRHQEQVYCMMALPRSYLVASKNQFLFVWLMLLLAMDYLKQVVGWHLILLIQCHVLRIKNK